MQVGLWPYLADSVAIFVYLWPYLAVPLWPYLSGCGHICTIVAIFGVAIVVCGHVWLVCRKMSFSGQLWKFFRTGLEWFFGQLWKKMDKFGNGKFSTNSPQKMTNFDKEYCEWVTIISPSQRWSHMLAFSKSVVWFLLLFSMKIFKPDRFPVLP